MPQVVSTFLNGRMDSDTSYPLLDNKSYTLARNLRISGEGKDGSFVTLKGSKKVSDEFTEEGGVIIGAYEGKGNKIYYAFAMPNGKSKIVEYNTLTESSKLIISDTKFLRFDLIRWKNGVEIKPYRYLLGINQIGNFLFISDKVWEYPRVIDVTKDYTEVIEDEIILVKKPPFNAPLIVNRSNNPNDIVDEEFANVFVSFAYRYKYEDGDYSALSFYTEASFEPKVFGIDGNRHNIGMENKYNQVQLSVKTGARNVTHVEVYAREHGSNSAYLIYNLNKSQSSVGNNQDFLVDYSYSKNYEILDEASTKMLYSNVPRFPNTQESVGNRMFYANFIEGFDLVDKFGNNVMVNYQVKKVQREFVSGGDNKTSVSMFSYKVSPIFYNDYNISSTALLPSDQKKAEVSINFNDRLKVNDLQVVFENTFKAPSFATKMKFAVKRTALNYENIVFSNIRKLGNKIYLYLNGENTNKVKQGEFIYFTKSDVLEYKPFEIEEVKLLRKDDGVSKDGYYAIIEDEDNFINFEKNAGVEGDYLSAFKANMDGAYQGTTSTNFTNINYTFGTTPTSYSFVTSTGQVQFKANGKGNLNYGSILSGDEIKVSFYIQMIRTLRNDADRLEDKVEVKKLTTIVDKDYSSLLDFLKENFADFKYTISGTPTNINFKTTNDFQNYMKENYPSTYNLENETGKRMNGIGVLEIEVKKGIKGGYARTKNKDVVEDQLYYETDKTYQIIDGEIIPDSTDGSGIKVFDINFYNGYSWGNGIESYKIRDSFVGKSLNNNFRPIIFDSNGFKAVRKTNDITYSGLYNYEMKRNELSVFNPTLANWKTLPSEHGEIQRLLSTDNNLTAYCNDRVMLVMYEKSIIYDLTGAENVALTNDVLGSIVVLDYKFGVGNNPESVVSTSNIHYFVDPIRKRFLLKSGKQIEELNGRGSGFFEEGIKLISESNSFLGSYDNSHDEYVVGFNGEKSVAFSLANKGFTSYFDNKYDYIIGANGVLFTGYKGVLYQNESTNNSNDLVGQGKFKSTLQYVVTPDMVSDKIFQAMYLQSNYAWNTNIKTNLHTSFIPKESFVQKESFFYNYIFRDNSSSVGIRGVGEIKNIEGNVLYFSSDIGTDISEQDFLKDESGFSSEIKTITENRLIVENGSGFNVGEFVFVSKATIGLYRPDGAPIRGQWMEVTLDLIPEKHTYITSAVTEVVKSNL